MFFADLYRDLAARMAWFNLPRLPGFPSPRAPEVLPFQPPAQWTPGAPITHLAFRRDNLRLSSDVRRTLEGAERPHQAGRLLSDGAAN